MTEAQKRFVELERKKEDVKKFFDELNAACVEVSKEVGVNGYFQDEQGIVYKVVIPDGKFVYFEHISYVRTRRPHEKRGDLSMKEATDAGYQLPTDRH
jgi:hypothetical protein